MSQGKSDHRNRSACKPSVAQLVSYFFRLGALGFGGPVALANYMRSDLVEDRAWLTEGEFDSGLAIAAACPGPLAYQLGVYCGYVRHGITGGVAVALAFGMAPFVLVLASAVAYTHFAANWQLRAAFYGVGPVVVALIFKACWNLGRKILGRNVWAWIFALTACGVTISVQKELTALFLMGGGLGSFLLNRGKPTPELAALPLPDRPAKRLGCASLAIAAPAGAFTGITARLFVFFFKTGCLVFGSGLVIVPFLRTYLVDQYHWLGRRAFLDSVAVGMISPGPVVITATFVGYLVGGFAGALASTIGIFAPAVLFTVLATPLLLRYGGNRRLRGFIRGITVTVVGVLVGTTYLVGRSAVGDWLTAGIAIVSLAVLLLQKNIPDPLVVAVGAVVGVLAYPAIRPEWLLK